MRKWILFLLALVILSPFAAQAADLGSQGVGLAAGVNGIWYRGDNAPFQADIEAAMNAKWSLVPHLSAVGGVDYGFAHSYFRGQAGVRATATDVENQDFSVGLGIEYHVSSLAGAVSEWAPEAGFGMRPYPAKFPGVYLVGLGWYGLQSQQIGADAGLRVRFNF